MTSQVETMQTTQDPRAERYRIAERRFWERHGLRPIDHQIPLGTSGSVRVQEVGSGAPVIFIHGTGGSGTYFAPLLASLTGVRALIVDRPGWTTSTMVDFRARPYQAIIESVLGAVLDGSGLERANVVGASIGDLWAVRYAIDHPDRVGRVVLLGGGPIAEEIQVPSFIRLLRSPLGQVIIRLPEREGMFRKQLAGMGHAASLEAGRITPDYIAWHGALTRDTDWGANERSMVQAIVGPRGFADGLVPTAAEVAALQAPVRMIIGSEDPVGNVDIWRRFVGRMPDGTLDVIDGSGHLLWLDDPAGVAARIDAALSVD